MQEQMVVPEKSYSVPMTMKFKDPKAFEKAEIQKNTDETQPTQKRHRTNENLLKSHNPSLLHRQGPHHDSATPYIRLRKNGVFL